MTNEKSSPSKKYYAIIGAGILGIAFLHFGLQMIFIQNENLRSSEVAIETENKNIPPVKENLPAEKVIEIKPEQFSIKEIEIKKSPETLKAEPRRQKEFVAPERKVFKKKEMPETRAIRLRRAERLLTGV